LKRIIRGGWGRKGVRHPSPGKLVGRHPGKIRSARGVSTHLLALYFYIFKNRFKNILPGAPLPYLKWIFFIKIQIFHLPPLSCSWFDITLIKFPVKNSRGGGKTFWQSFDYFLPSGKHNQLFLQPNHVHSIWSLLIDFFKHASRNIKDDSSRLQELLFINKHKQLKHKIMTFLWLKIYKDNYYLDKITSALLKSLINLTCIVKCPFDYNIYCT